MGKILITGGLGQVGFELASALIKRYESEKIIISDIKAGDKDVVYIDVTKKEDILKILKSESVEIVYHMAAILSARGEREPELAWNVNVNGLINILELAKEMKICVFWPSSIAVFGDTTPRIRVPQHTITEPDTMYGITKLVGERLCEYYWKKWGVDVRSLRYPGLLSWKVMPGGGTTDYAIDMIVHAVEGKGYTCPLSPDRELPMMHIDDAVQATIMISEAPSEKIKVRSSYNLAAFSFSPAQLHEEIRKYYPEFNVEYRKDFRDEIASTWPRSVDDSEARAHWGWQHTKSFEDTVKDLIEGFRRKLKYCV